MTTEPTTEPLPIVDQLDTRVVRSPRCDGTGSFEYFTGGELEDTACEGCCACQGDIYRPPTDQEWIAEQAARVLSQRAAIAELLHLPAS